MVCLFTTAYFAATSTLASLKPLWFDELLTYNIARQPTAGAVWMAWLEASEQIPPVVHFATHLSGSMLGFSHITARLPAMVGFWVMCLSIFVFLRRRVGLMLALMGMLLPLSIPQAYFYAYEARAYGMVLGFCGAAVVCWDLAHATPWRGLALLGLPLCLAAAVASHPYAVLVVVPLALAELARSLARRRTDWWVWAGLASVVLVILPPNPITSHIRRYPQVARWAGSRVTLFALIQLWGQFLSVTVAYLGLLVLVCLGWDRMARAPAAPIRQARPPAGDWALVLGLVALPVVGWLLANLVTGLLLFRYVIPAVIGFSLGIPLLCRGVVKGRPWALLAAGWVAVAAAWNMLDARHEMRTTGLTTQHIAAGPGCFALLSVWSKLPQRDSPIVLSDFYVFHQIHHYAPEPLKRRLVFLVDRQSGGLIEPYMSFYRRVFGERMEPFDEFLRAGRSFYLYDCGSPGRLPLVSMLLRANASLRDSGLHEIPDAVPRRDLYRVAPAGVPRRRSSSSGRGVVGWRRTPPGRAAVRSTSAERGRSWTGRGPL